MNPSTSIYIDRRRNSAKKILEKSLTLSAMTTIIKNKIH